MKTHMCRDAPRDRSNVEAQCLPRRDFLKQVSMAGVAWGVLPHDTSRAMEPGAENPARPSRPAGLLDRFAVIGDTHYPKHTGSGSRIVGVDDRMDFLNDAIAHEKRIRGLDFLVHIGDVVHSDGTITDHQWFHDHILSVHGVPSFVCYGNHDLKAGINK